MAKKPMDAAAEWTGGKAEVVVAFDGAPDGAVYPRTHAPGEIIEGDLAAVAVREGWAKPIGA